MKRYFLFISTFLAALCFNTGKVEAQAFSSLSYPGPQVYTTGTTISPVSPVVSGGPAASGGQTTQLLAGSAQGYANGTGSAALFYLPTSLVTDRAGNVYVGDSQNNVVRKITPAGVVTTFAGSGTAASTDGTGLSASFNHPAGMAIDLSGNLYVSDQYSHKIRKITAAGVVTTLAGSGSAGSTDGTGSGASFNNPTGLACDASGNIYVGDYSNHKIRKITSVGVVTTLAGTGSVGANNGAGGSATFNGPMGVAVDGAGNVYVADRLNFRVRKITSGGTVSTLAGSGTAGSSDNVTGTSATFNRPTGVAVDGSGNVYVADEINYVIRKITSAGSVSTFAGAAGSSGATNATGSSVRFYSPYGITIDNQNSLYLAELLPHRIRKVITQPYIFYPAPPVGLGFNNTTGVISGYPTIPIAAANYYVQAFNTTYSSAVATINITVNAAISGITGSYDQNYITTYTPQNDTYTTYGDAVNASTNKDNVQTTIQYFDGLGRPMQTVQVKGNNDGTKDIVVPVEYDNLGRLKKSFLPYEATTANGTYKTDGLTYVGTFYATASTNRVQTSSPHSVPIYEPSPMNRIAEQGAPGASWQPVPGANTGHTQKMEYSVNIISDAVKLWKITATTVSTAASYATGQLTKTISKDENWVSADGVAGTVEEYKDMEGNVVCKRVWKDASTALSTYYVYDEYNRLRYVIPPKVTATTINEGGMPDFKELTYAYHYDAKGRLIEKKIPGKAWEEFAYDKLDRLTMSRDTMQKIAGKWLFTKYDGVGRVAYTGRIASTDTRATHQTALDGATYVYVQRDDANASGTGSGYTSTSMPNTVGAEVYTVNYYDDYSFWGNPYGGASGTQSTAVKGLMTGSRVNTLPAGSTLISANYYDGKGQLVQSKSNNLLSGTDVSDVAYNFNGSLKNSVRTHTVSSTVTTITTRYKYDHMGRKLTTKMQMQTKVGAAAPTVGAETVLSKLEYNAIGQLYKKYLHSTDSTNYLQNTRYAYNERGWLKRQLSSEFSMKLDYDTAGSAQYNGNIGKQYFGSGTSFPNTFSYVYDKLNRLTSGVNSGTLTMSESIGYDNIGNISSMDRDVAGSSGYTYYNGGNRLKSITGASISTSIDYQYDFNGNANFDGRTGIAMGYNALNLPETAVRTSPAPAVNVAYTYDGAGTKLKKVVTAPGLSTRYYVGGIEYSGSTIDIIQTDEGIARNSGGTYTYEYNLTDHLGNVRYVFGNTAGPGIALQRTDYYPFGQKKVATGSTSNYLYNGKELQPELTQWLGPDGQYDYDARLYDPVVARWNRTDAKSELYFQISPYAYAANMPINAIDPDGHLVIFVNGQHTGNGGTEEYWKGTKQIIDGMDVFNPKTVTMNFAQNFKDHFNDQRAVYLDGARGGFRETLMYGFNLYSETRIKDGSTLGKDGGAAAIIKSLKRTNGVISESIKIVAHSMGAAYAKGLITEIVKYAKAHPEECRGLSITEYDFAAFQQNSLSAIKGVPLFQIDNKGDQVVDGFIGWLNGSHHDKQEGREEFGSFDNFNPDGGHAILDFLDAIKDLKEGKYKFINGEFVKQ